MGVAASIDSADMAEIFNRKNHETSIFLVLLVVACTGPRPPAGEVWIDNVTVISADRDKEGPHQSVHIVDGKIAAISASKSEAAQPDTALHIDGTG